jgi:hypothetical protein
MSTADISHPEAHAALSCKYFLHVFKLPKSSWRDNILKKINFTFHMKYDDYQPFNRIKKYLLNGPVEKAFIDPLTNELTHPSLIIYLLVMVDATNHQDLLPNVDRIV